MAGSYSDKRLKELKSLKMRELNADNETVWMRNETTHTQQGILEGLDLQKPPKITGGKRYQHIERNPRHQLFTSKE